MALKSNSNKPPTNSHGLIKSFSSKSLSKRIQNFNSKILGKRHSLSIFKFYQNATSPTQINSNDYEFFRLNNALSKSNSRLEKSTSDQFFKTPTPQIVLEQEKAIKRNESLYKLNFKIKSNITFNQKEKKTNKRSKSVPTSQRKSIFSHANRRNKPLTPKNLKALTIMLQTTHSYCKYCESKLDETNRQSPSVLLNR
jgi:hypothetical protein